MQHIGLTYKHDNAGALKVRVAMNCLQACRILPWPAWSPDLPPIEHVWKAMRRRLQPSRNIDDLVQQLETVWHEILQDIIQ